MSRFAFVAAERANHAVATLCRIVGASVSGFHAWLHGVAAKDPVLAELKAQVEREIARGNVLAAQLAELRRPWWRRLLK